MEAHVSRAAPDASNGISEKTLGKLRDDSDIENYLISNSTQPS